MRKLSRKLVTLSAAALLSPAALAAVPVIPGGAGFGMETPAGRGGKIFRITSLQDSGAGTLRECVDASGPRICIFETSGTIQLKDDLKILNPYITIAGQTAPAPGIVAVGGGLLILASNVLVQHIAVRPGDDPSGPSPSSRDALRINARSGSTTNVVVDHCSFSWSVDEVVDVAATDNITLSNNIFGAPLDDSIHPEGPHAFTALVGDGVERVSVVGNVFAHSRDRNPRSGAGQLILVNNVSYDYMWIAAYLFSKGGATLNSLVGNHFVRGPVSADSASAIRLSGGSNTLPQGTKIYLSDNVGHEPNGNPAPSDQWTLVKNDSGLSRSSLEATSPPAAWPAGLVARPTVNGEAWNHVLDNAGSRPAQRSAVDAKIVSDVRNRTGGLINCVASDGTARCQANGGGWPDYAQNRRALTLPPNPNGDDDGDGYTNVEEWLHGMATEVEGKAQARPEPPFVEVL